MEPSRYQGPFSNGKSIGTLALIGLIGAGSAHLMLPAPGDREAQVARDLQRGLEEARQASMRAQGLPDFIPETKEEWALYCEGWPDHRLCITMQETGFPFSRTRVENQCGWEKRIREDGSVEVYESGTQGLRLEWKAYSERLTPETICTAFGIDIEG